MDSACCLSFQQQQRGQTRLAQADGAAGLAFLLFYRYLRHKLTESPSVLPYRTAGEQQSVATHSPHSALHMSPSLVAVEKLELH